MLRRLTHVIIDRKGARGFRFCSVVFCFVSGLPGWFIPGTGTVTVMKYLVVYAFFT